METMQEIYELDGKINPLKGLPFGLQHVLAMFVANITPIMIIAGACGVGQENVARLILPCSSPVSVHSSSFSRSGKSVHAFQS